MKRSKGRVQPCDRADARTRLIHAERFMEVALLVAEEPDSELSYSSTAASLAVLAGIAATDAACCAAQGARFRGQDHR